MIRIIVAAGLLALLWMILKLWLRSALRGETITLRSRFRGRERQVSGREAQVVGWQLFTLGFVVFGLGIVVAIANWRP